MKILIREDAANYVNNCLQIWTGELVLSFPLLIAQFEVVGKRA